MEIENVHYQVNNEENIYLDYIPTIENNISYNEFFKKYLVKNQACVIKNIANNWESYKTWCNNDEIAFNHLSKYNDLDVMIYNCGKKHYNSQETQNYKFQDYVKYWMQLKENGDNDKDMPLLYLKDWHLKNCTDDNFYEVPIYFSSDMLNEYLCDNNEDDYRFVYMGPAGTW